MFIYQNKRRIYYEKRRKCCKYRRIKGDYHRLVEDPVDLPQSHTNNQVIEMEQKEKNEEKLDEKEVKIQGP